MEIELSDGLLEIGEEAFYGCNCLKQITLPSTVRTISHRAFYNAANISTVHLPDNIQKFGNRYGCEAFSRCYKLANFRMSPPRNNSTIPNEIVCMCMNLFSMEIAERDVRFLNSNAFAFCNSLRNIAIPHNVSNIGWFYRTDLRQLFRTDNEIIDALQHRFDNLPVHKMVYYKSYNNMTVGQLNNAEGKSLRMRLASMFSVRRISTGKNNEQKDRLGIQQDCLGMTPLHIMACSTEHNIELYRVLVEKYPENLISRDGWGALPLFYAVWGNAPDEIVQFLIESHQSIYPDRLLDLTDILIFLAQKNLSFDRIRSFIDIQESFAKQTIDWARFILFVCDDLYNNYTDEMFLFILQCRIRKRVNAIGIKKWRDTIINISAKEFSKPRLASHMDSNLTKYEKEYINLKEATTMIELTLWKNQMTENFQEVDGHNNKRAKIDETDRRKECRINCGAHIVIEHVLPYLM